MHESLDGEQGRTWSNYAYAQANLDLFSLQNCALWVSLIEADLFNKQVWLEKDNVFVPVEDWDLPIHLRYTHTNLAIFASLFMTNVDTHCLRIHLILFEWWVFTRFFY